MEAVEATGTIMLAADMAVKVAVVMLLLVEDIRVEVRVEGIRTVGDILQVVAGMLMVECIKVVLQAVLDLTTRNSELAIGFGMLAFDSGGKLNLTDMISYT